MPKKLFVKNFEPKKPEGLARLIVDGYEKIVDEALSLKSQIESLQEKLDEKEKILKSIGVEEMQKDEDDGIFMKTCVISGTLQHANITRSNTFKKLDLSYETLVRDTVGDSFKILFQRSTKLTPKKGMEDCFLVDANTYGLHAERYFEIEEYLFPKTEYLEKRAVLRTVLDSKKNETLDGITKESVFGVRITYK